MKRCFIIFTIIILSIFWLDGKSQNLTQVLDSWTAKNPIEKVYIHTDRKVYFSGQTIWLKSYFTSNFRPSSDNSTLFVELHNTNSGVILKKVLPVFNSITYGQIELPDSLSTGTYWLRAYTPLMLNQNKSYLYSTPIKVFGRNDKTKKQIVSVDDKNVDVKFYPEGGNLISGVSNTVAFKATTAEGLPFNISGVIKDNSGKAMATFSTLHNGMGKFTFTPVWGKTYNALIENNSQSFLLPKPLQNGMAVQSENNNGTIHFVLSKSSTDAAFQPEYCIAQMQNHVVLKQTVNQGNKNEWQGDISTKNLRSGILQLTFFNKDDMPLAERLFFINNKEYLLPATLNTLIVNSSPRKQNNFSIDFPDTVHGDFSIAVTDADYDVSGPRKENIISTMLLTSDLPGFIYDPAWYFSGDANAPEALDLLMLTNGWRRFSWTDVVANKLQKSIYNDPGYISLSGTAKIRGSKKTFADRDLLAWMETPNASPNLRILKTDAGGNFKLDSLVFFDKAKILFSDIMGNKSKFITVKLNTDSLYKAYNLPPFKTPFTPFSNAGNNSLSAKMQSAYFDYSRGEGLLLDNVNIEGRRLTEDELEKKYMSGLFLNDINARTINLTGQFIPQWNVLDWLMGRVPSLNINRLNTLGDNYSIAFRQQPVQLFLDEMPLNDASLISTIPSNQIAFVKIFPQFIGAKGNRPALAIYTKRGDDLADDMETSGDIIDYDGYSIIKEYYSPDYSQPVETNYRDYRLTLNWRPEILLNGNTKMPVSFYNNDRTKRFKIVAEGITDNGKFLMLEKTIEVK